MVRLARSGLMRTARWPAVTLPARASWWTVLGLAGLSVLAAVGWSQRADVAPALGRLSPVVLVVVVGSSAVANLVLAENWYQLSLAGTRATRTTSWRIFGLAQPLRYLMPGGHIAARGALATREGLTVRAGVGLGVLDLLLSVCVLTLLTAVTTPAWLGPLAGRAIPGWVPLLGVAPAALALVLIVRPDVVGSGLDRIVGRVVGRSARLPAAPLLRAKLLRYLGAVLVRAAGFVVLVLAMGRAGGAADAGAAATVGAALGAFAVGNVAGRLAPIAPAGLGIRDVGMAVVLTGPLGLGAATAVALAARVLDLLAEGVLVGGLLLGTSGRDTVLRPGAVLTLDDGRRVDIISVKQRTWSNVAVGRLGDQEVFCKQSLDRRGRPDPAASQRQQQAYAEVQAGGLRAPGPVGAAGREAIEVREWRPLREPEDPGAVAIWVLTQLAMVGPGHPSPALAATGLLIDESTSPGADLPDSITVVDPDRAPSAAALFDVADCRARLIATLLLSNWGRPLRAFIAGPDWPAAARTWQATRPRGAAERVAGLADIRRACRDLVTARRREWVGVTPAQALVRFVGVHTIGWLYARRLDRGIAEGRLGRAPADLDEQTRRRYGHTDRAAKYDHEARGPIGRAITAGERRALRRALAVLCSVGAPATDRASRGHPGRRWWGRERQHGASLVESWVDVAGGTGRFASLAGLAGARRISVDRSAAMLARDASGLRVIADAERLPLPGASVDVAVMMRLVHRTSDVLLVAAVREALRVSRRGVLVSYTRPTPGWRRQLRRLVGRKPAAGGRSEREVAGLVAAAGGVVRSDVAAIPLLSGGRVLAVSRTASRRGAMIVPSERPIPARPDPRGVARAH